MPLRSPPRWASSRLVSTECRHDHVPRTAGSGPRHQLLVRREFRDSYPLRTIGRHAQAINGQWKTRTVSGSKDRQTQADFRGLIRPGLTPEIGVRHLGRLLNRSTGLGWDTGTSLSNDAEKRSAIACLLEGPRPFQNRGDKTKFSHDTRIRIERS
jgi:hypothetical protein